VKQTEAAASIASNVVTALDGVNHMIGLLQSQVLTHYRPVTEGRTNYHRTALQDTLRM